MPSVCLQAAAAARPCLRRRARSFNMSAAGGAEDAPDGVVSMQELKEGGCGAVGHAGVLPRPDVRRGTAPQPLRAMMGDVCCAFRSLVATVLKTTLRSRGVVDQVKARLRAEIYNALDDQVRGTCAPSQRRRGSRLVTHCPHGADDTTPRPVQLQPGHQRAHSRVPGVQRLQKHAQCVHAGCVHPLFRPLRSHHTGARALC